MIKRLIFSLSITAYLPVVSSATIIHVPADFPTIQAAIDSTSNGDTVMVAPGTYTGGGNQNISTGGKAITVTTSGGPLVTVIDGSIIERGFDINGGEDSTTILEGFTIFNSYCGVYCDSSAPTVRNMIIKDFLNYGIHFDGFLADPPIAPVVENCLIFQEDQQHIGTGNGFHGIRGIDVRISGCLFQDLTYGLEFHTIDNRPPNFNIDKCIIRNNVVDGLWAHS
jgi:hypothetical protein